MLNVPHIDMGVDGQITHATRFEESPSPTKPFRCGGQELGNVPFRRSQIERSPDCQEVYIGYQAATFGALN